jgi:putative flippase GtrA
MTAVWLGQALKFLAVGVLNTMLDAGVYLVLTRWLGFAAWKILAKGISYGVGVLNSFYCNKSWTFQAEASSWTTLALFVLSNLLAMIINAGIMRLSLSGFHWHEFPSFVLATSITFLWNFTISKFLIFRKQPARPPKLNQTCTVS